jgi:hypothetical protein
MQFFSDAILWGRINHLPGGYSHSMVPGGLEVMS